MSDDLIFTIRCTCPLCMKDYDFKCTSSNYFEWLDSLIDDFHDAPCNDCKRRLENGNEEN